MKQKIINALKLNKLAYDAVRENFKRGMSEADIKQIILTACKETEDFSGDIVGECALRLLKAMLLIMF